MLLNKNISPKDEIIAKTGMIYWAIIIIAVLIFFSLLNIMFFQNEKWEKEVNKRAFILKKDKETRGDIYDETGKLLATSVPYYNIYMDTRAGGLTDGIFNENIDSLSYCLSKLFEEKTKEEYLKKIKIGRDSNRRAVSIASQITYEQLQTLKTFPLFRRKRNVSGLVPNIKVKRERPFGELLRRTIGFRNEDEEINTQIGKAGLEKYYDRELSGKPGEVLMQKLANGVLMPVNVETRGNTEEGLDLITSVNINLQDFTDYTLRKHLKAANADHGSIVVMDVKTGYIKAMVNLKRAKDSLYYEKLNHSVGESLAPGSTFKLPVLIAALEDGYVTLKDKIFVGNGHVEYFGVPVDDDHAYLTDELTVQQVFEKSSNVGMAKIVYDYYFKPKRIEKLTDRLYDMGFGVRTGIDIDGERIPIIKTPDHPNWANSTPMMMSHGYELMISPLQVLTFYNAIANEGEMMKPKLVKAFQRHGEIIKYNEPETLVSSICSDSTLINVKKILRGVILRGTAPGLKSDKIKIAGKTGTAKYYDPKLKKHIDEYRASFVGFFPADNPKYSCIVVVNKPQGDYYGGTIAAPIFKKIALKILTQDDELNPQKLEETGEFAFSQVPYSKSGYKDDADMVFSSVQIPIGQKGNYKTDWITTKKHRHSVEYLNRNVKKNFVPDVTDMGAKDAVYLLESMGLNVKLSGRGSIVSQSIRPDTPIGKNMKILIELR